MPSGRGPSLQAQVLGRRLREMREEAGRTLRDAAEHIQRNQSTVSRFESGDYLIRRPDVLALLDLYAVSDAADRDAILKMFEAVWQEDWWQAYLKAMGDRTLLDIVWLESEARVIKSVVVALLPGLLQTQEYASEAIRRWDPGGTEDTIADLLKLRLKRQQILHGDNPTRLEVVMDEAALRRLIGSREGHRRQLQHLLEMAKKPNVVITVVPFSVGWHPGLEGACSLFEMPDPYPRRFGLVETPAGAQLVENDKYDHLEWIFQTAAGLSSDLRGSAQLITDIMEDLHD